MSDAEAWHNREDPAQIVTPAHRNRDLLQGEDDSCAKGTEQEVDEEGENLRIDIRREDEGRDVREWHYRRWEEHKEHPNAIVELAEREHEQYNQTDGDIRHEYIEDKVGHPVASQ